MTGRIYLPRISKRQGDIIYIFYLIYATINSILFFTYNIFWYYSFININLFIMSFYITRDS